jgi:endonuclease/exonuclease/phosphatase family metal-dependent hydrolase
MRLRLVTFNIRHGEGLEGRQSLEEQGGLLRATGADIVFLQEVDDVTLRCGGVSQSLVLAELVGLPYFAFGKNMDLQGGGYGNAILSRFRLTEVANHPISPEKRESPRLFEPDGKRYVPEPRSILEATADIGGVPHHLLCSHFGFLAGEATDGVERLEALLRSLSGPVVFAGDLNVHGDAAPEVARLRELFPQSAPYGDGQETMTYPAHAPALRLDYLFLTRPYRIERFKVLETLTSDHRPLLVEASSEPDPHPRP